MPEAAVRVYAAVISHAKFLNSPQDVPRRGWWMLHPPSDQYDLSRIRVVRTTRALRTPLRCRTAPQRNGDQERGEKKSGGPSRGRVDRGRPYEREAVQPDVRRR